MPVEGLIYVISIIIYELGLFLGSGAYDYSKKGTKMDIEFLQEFIGREFYHLGPRSNVGK